VVNVILPSVVAPSTFIAILVLSKHHHTHNNQGVLPERERLSTFQLLIKVACFVTKVNNIFNVKINFLKLRSTRRFIVLSLSLA
jgi:hypothetical protein